MIFQHARFQIWNANQHPFLHSLADFVFNHPAMPGVGSVESALNYIAAVLYPQSKAAVATPAALPLVGNSINDMRVVTDDGDGKAASYRWEQREGDVAAKWYKIYDLDWGTDSILTAFLLKTQDIYVKQRGYDDLDSSGSPVVGTLAGQSIYGGASANTNLTLFANSGDGTGASTGFVQFGDQVRPTATNTFDFGTTGLRWAKGWFTQGQFGTLALSAGSVVDSSGSLSFGNNALSTSSTVVAGTLTLGSGSITDSSGTISFGSTALTTTGTGTFNHIVATTAASSFFTGTTIADFTFTNGNIASSSATVSFNALNLSTSGSGTFGQVNVDNLRLDGSTLSTTNANGDLNLSPNGTGKVLSSNAVTFSGLFTVSGADAAITNGKLTISGTGSQLIVDNLSLDGNTLSVSTSNLLLSTAGGDVRVNTRLAPSVDNTSDLGNTGLRWSTLYLSSSIASATQTFNISALMVLRNNNFRDAAQTLPAQNGDALFYDSVSGTWLASVPDSEIVHNTLSGLTTGDAGHTQFALLAGRAGGQSLVGGTAASNNLNLESTSNGTKGFIQTKDSFQVFTDASFSGSWSGADLGGASNRFRHVYTAGEHFGLRLENVGALPSASTQNVGRLVFLTTDGDPYVDTGTAFKRITQNKFLSDTSWNGTDVTKTVTVSASLTDARTAVWQLCDNTNDYERIFCSIKAISATQVTITVGSALTAGSYRLIGIE